MKEKIIFTMKEKTVQLNEANEKYLPHATTYIITSATKKSNKIQRIRKTELMCIGQIMKKELLENLTLTGAN